MSVADRHAAALARTVKTYASAPVPADDLPGLSTDALDAARTSAADALEAARSRHDELVVARGAAERERVAVAADFDELTDRREPEIDVTSSKRRPTPPTSGSSSSPRARPRSRASPSSPGAGSPTSSSSTDVSRRSRRRCWARRPAQGVRPAAAPSAWRSLLRPADDTEPLPAVWASGT